MDITKLVAEGKAWTITCEDGRNIFRATEDAAREWVALNRHAVIGVTDPDGRDAWGRMVAG
jgi:hypothetical protein